MKISENFFAEGQHLRSYSSKSKASKKLIKQSLALKNHLKLTTKKRSRILIFSPGKSDPIELKLL
jgi:hypothetical protein